MPDLRQLRVFVAVAEHRSFTRAGEEVHLRQQSVSKAVQELERELGVELLERTTREVRLTRAGRVLLEEGKRALEVSEAAFARTREVGAGLAGTIRIGCSPAVGPTDQVDAAQALRSGSPDLSVDLLETRPATLRPLLRAGELDLALTRVAGADDPALHRAELRPTPLVLCVGPGHRLAGRTAAQLTELEGERLLTASPPGTPYTDLLLDRLAEHGVSVVSVEARVTGGAALPSQLAAHDAVALVAVGTPTPPDVVTLRLDGVSVPLLLLWSAGRPSPAVARLQQAMGVRAT